MKNKSYEIQEDITDHRHFICWKSLFAGFLVSLLTYIVLTSVGAGIGGMMASNLISHEESGAGLATGTGVWLGLSAAISLFVGSFFALRLARFITPKVGASHGLILGSVFFILMVWGLGSGVSSVASGLGKTVLAATNGVSNIANNPSVQDVLQRSLGNAQLKSTPKEVIEGLAVRLLQGNRESAKSYLAFQTSLSDSEVEARMAQLQADFELRAKAAGDTTAKGVSAAGWSLFLTFLVGIAASLVGGVTAAKLNSHKPIARYSSAPIRTGSFVTA